VTRLKDPDAAVFMTDALALLDPAVIVCTTAFAAGGNPGEPTPLDGPDVPVLQAIIASTKRAAWAESPRGLGASDLAMNVVLPELERPHSGRRHLLQASIAGTSGPGLHGARQPTGARPRRDAGRSCGGAGAIAHDPAPTHDGSRS